MKRSISQSLGGLAVLAATLLAAGPAAAALPVLCGFNNARGGIESLANSGVAGLRAAIVAQFPGVKFHLVGHLTSTTLASCNVVYLGVATSPTSGIKPLSKAEQSALRAFVDAGGSAALFTDNDTFVTNAPAINASLLTPFGVTATGTLDGNQAITLKSGTNPVASGPAGTIGQLDTFFPGWLSKFGKSKDLGTFTANSQPGLAWLPAGVLETGSGPVVMFADSSLLLDGTRTAEDTTGILNAFALGLD